MIQTTSCDMFSAITYGINWVAQLLCLVLPLSGPVQMSDKYISLMTLEFSVKRSLITSIMIRMIEEKNTSSNHWYNHPFQFVALCHESKFLEQSAWFPPDCRGQVEEGWSL